VEALLQVAAYNCRARWVSPATHRNATKHSPRTAYTRHTHSGI